MGVAQLAQGLAASGPVGEVPGGEGVDPGLLAQGAHHPRDGGALPGPRVRCAELGSPLGAVVRPRAPTLKSRGLFGIISLR